MIWTWESADDPLLNGMTVRLIDAYRLILADALESWLYWRNFEPDERIIDLRLPM